MKLLKTTNKQRYYQLDFKIKKHFGYGELKTIEEMFMHDPIKLRDGYEQAEDITKFVNKICISDAHTHIERLVFPAFYIKNKETNEVEICHTRNTIDGIMTMMIHGGSSRSVYDDKVYIRHLRRKNNKCN